MANLEVALAELEASWIANNAAKAADARTGVLDPAEVDEVRRFHGWGMGETYAALEAARDGAYCGAPLAELDWLTRDK